jgi:hypothetical protein
MEQKRVRALYDYKAADNTELGFKKGDVIVVMEVDESGWWQGKLGNSTGMFPSNYCEPIKEQPKASAGRQSIAAGRQSITNSRRKVNQAEQTMHNSNTRYRAWAGNMALGWGLCGIPIAAVGFYWLQVKEFNTSTNAFCVAYAL